MQEEAQARVIDRPFFSLSDGTTTLLFLSPRTQLRTDVENARKVDSKKYLFCIAQLNYIAF